MCEELLQRSTSCEEINVVISLPVEVREEGSDNLDDYIDCKRNQHEEIIKQMREEIEKVVDSVETDVSQNVTVAREEFDSMKREICATDIDEIASIAQWISYSEKIKKINLQFKTVIDDLSVDLKCFQKFRSEEINKILIKYRDKAIALSFFSKEDNDRVFEDEINIINLKIIKSCKTHEDVNFQLEVESHQIKHEFARLLKTKAHHLSKEYAKYLYEKIKRRHSKQILTESVYSLAQGSFQAREDLLQATNNLVKGLSDVTDGLQLPFQFGVESEILEEWVENVTAKLAALEEQCHNVNDLLKLTIGVMDQIYNHHIAKITRNMSENFDKTNSTLNETSGLSAELQSLKNRQTDDIQCLQRKWQQTIDVLSVDIEKTKCFARDLTAMWGKHIARVSSLQDDITASIEDSYDTLVKRCNDKTDKLKGQIKAVREASDVNKLTALCENLQKKFEEIVRDWEDGYEDQLEKLDEIKRKGVKILVEKKLSDISNFLNVKYSKRQWFTRSLSSDPPVPIPTTESTDEIDRQIDLCKIYMTTLENRTLGMYEMLERFVPTCESSVVMETEEWMNLCMQEIVNKYDAKVVEINRSQRKTMENLRKIRFAELHIHSDRLISHSSAVKLELIEFNERYERIKSKQKLAIDAFNKKVSSLSEIQPGPRGIKHELNELQREWSLLSKELEKDVSDEYTFCENRTAVLMQSNNLFLNIAKSFKNGGNYSPEEMKTLNKELKELEKSIVNKKKALFKNYNDLFKTIKSSVLDSTRELINDEEKLKSLENSVVNNLGIIRMRLRTEIDIMKFKGKTIKQNISCFTSLQHVDNSLIKNILTQFNQMNEYMKFPDGVSSLECTESRQSSSVKSLTTTKTAKTQKSKKPNVFRPTAAPLFKNSTDEIPFDENNYLARTKGLLLKKYNSFRENIQETHGWNNEKNKEGKSTPLKNKPLKVGDNSDNVALQIKQIKLTLLSYNSECELAWFGQLQDFLGGLVNLRKSFIEKAEHQLLDIHKNYIIDLKHLEEENVRMIQGEERNWEQKREKLQKSFVLPLAHPSHQHKLLQFQDGAKKLCQSQKNEHNEIVLRYKDNLQKKHDEYVKILKNLKESLNESQSLLFEKELCKAVRDLSKQIKNVFPFEPNFLEEGVRRNGTYLFSYPLSIWYDAAEIDQSHEETQSLILILLSSSSKSSLSSSVSSNNEVVVISVDKIAAEHVKESALKVQKLFDQAKSYQNTHQADVDEWLDYLESYMKEAQLELELCL